MDYGELLQGDLFIPKTNRYFSIPARIISVPQDINPVDNV